ncbi:hypothetical protein [Candidatus Nitrosocosmicus franklandus]|nr:hypothetical protein [Candidatus Nitrosocosmicus franklandus]
MMKFIVVSIFVILPIASFEYVRILTGYGDTSYWPTFIFDDCNMSMNYPSSFKTEQIANEFGNGEYLILHSQEPYVSVMVECNNLDKTFLEYDQSKDDSRGHEKLMGYDDFVIEDINNTKWDIDGQNALSFLFASGENAHTGVVTTNEVIYSIGSDTTLMIKFTALYREFDSFQIQELERKMINSIDLF